MRDLIFLSLENWDEIWRRNQFVCAELARRFPQKRILFVGKSLFTPHLARMARSSPGRRAVKTMLTNRFWSVPDHPNIHVFNPVKPFPNPVPGGRAFNENTVAAQIRGAARRAGLSDPLLWINPYDAGFLIGRLGERGVVYDITDDWELAAKTPEIRARIAALDRDLCRRADLTMVCSQALFDGRREVAKNLLLVPNGVDAAHYARLDDFDRRETGNFDEKGVFHAQNSPKSDDFAKKAALGAENGANFDPNGANEPETVQNQSETVQKAPNQATPNQATPNQVAPENAKKTAWPRPVFGYTGTLHRERIDLDLVLQLARAHPSGSVVLVGPQNWTDDSLREAIAKQPNLHAPGPVPYARIPEIMARFDVCIVPHRRSEFVESLNPIKLWEYLACGKPIAAMDVAGFRDFPHLVRLANDARGFIGACRAALGEVNGEKSLLDARRSEARGHSWTARVNAMLGEWHALGLIDETQSSQNQPKGESDASGRAVLDGSSS